MRIIETLILIVFAYFLLSIFWPFLILLIAVIVFQLYKARRILRQNTQEASASQPNKNYETFSQDGSKDVIDADYSERSPSDGSK